MPKKESGMWRNKNAPMSKNYRRGGSTYMGGGMTPEEQSSIYRGGPSQPTTGMKKGGTFGNFKVPTLDGKPRRITRKTPQESKVRKKPGMATGGITNINKRTLAKMTPKQLKSKTMTDYFNSKVSESRKGRKKGPGR